MKKSARLFISLLSLVFCLWSFASPVSAQSQNPYTTPNINPDVPKNMHNWTQNVMIEVMSAMTCQLAGIDPVNPNQECLGIDPETHKIGFVKNGGGAIGLMGNMIAMTFTPPIHLSDYTQYLAQNFGIAKPVYAQNRGVGFNGLAPLLPLWTAFRNIVYMLYVAVFVIIGFAIMLRIKIDPRTVMSMGNQLPKIIVSILLVTFSYAIAGGLIDLMYVSTYVVMNTFSSKEVISTMPGTIEDTKSLRGDYVKKVTKTQQTLNGDNALGVFNNLVGFQEIVTNSAGGVKDIVQRLFTTSSGVKADNNESGNTPVLSWFADVVKGAFDGFRNILGWLLGWIAGFLAFLIIGIAIIWAMFRLWFQLISAYVYFLIDVVFAPFWIIAGILPASPIGFSAWLREVISNLAPFPVTITMFLLGKVFINAFSGAGNVAFVPPMIGNINGGNVWLGGEGISPIGAFIGLGIILITPQVVAMMKDLLKPPEFKQAASIGQALGVGPGIAGGAASAIASPYGALSSFRNLKGLLAGGDGKAGGIKGLFGGKEVTGTVGATKEHKSE